MRSKVLRYIRERKLMHAGERVCVAVSGGADSVALLRVLLELRPELGIVLTVAHFNHRLRGDDSEADEAFVADMAQQCGLEFFAGGADVRQHARAGKLSIEAAGRKLRYRWLIDLAEQQKLDAIATAHTLDDQAETVLLKFLRGAGTRGLAGIFPEMPAGTPKNTHVIRPLLCLSRDEVEAYLGSLGQTWREDESNFDRRIVRNRVRHELLPLLEREYNPNLRHALSDSAELWRAEEEYWQALIRAELKVRMQPQRLNLHGFGALPLALQRHVLRGFAETANLALDFEHLEQLLRCALGEQEKSELTEAWMVIRRGDCLYLDAPGPKQPCFSYKYLLPAPGEVRIAEVGLRVRAILVRNAPAIEDAETDNLLSAEMLGPTLTIRNWRPGDRFWPAHTGSEEKLKRLFAEKHIPAEERQTWPVALCGEQIVWVRGFPVARAFAWKGSGDAVKIESFESG